MTKTEQAALDELNMTPEALAAKQEHISQLLNGSDKLGEQLKASIALVDPNFGAGNTPEITHSKPTRRPRKDKGTHRVKPTAIAQQPGFLTPEQASRLTDLINSQESRRIELESAEAHKALCLGQLDAARQELYYYLLELQGKKTG